MSHLDAKFGVEIECYMPEGGRQVALAAAVGHRINKQVLVQNYNHDTITTWKIVTDGSLNDYSRGIEIVSPPLSGEDGLTEVQNVIRALADFGCSVSKKCGLHVHVGLVDARQPGESLVPLACIKRLVNLYAGFEPIIDSIMPASRRANTNQYCRSITSAAPATINAATTLNDIISAVGNGRFVKLNLHSYSKYRTAEFRQHAGSLDATKVRNWTLTCLRMVAAARNGKMIRQTTPAAIATAHPINHARVGSKSWQVGEMMLRPEGVTGPEAREAVGWPSISMPDQARICGLTVTTQKIGRTVRYFARAAQAQIAAAEPVISPTPITLLGFMDMIESDTAEREYLLQRQSDLGGPIQWAA